MKAGLLRAAEKCDSTVDQIERERDMHIRDNHLETVILKRMAELFIAEAAALPEDDSHKQYETPGYALAMEVLQSDLYHKLNDRARAECDEFIRVGMQPDAARRET